MTRKILVCLCIIFAVFLGKTGYAKKSSEDKKETFWTRIFGSNESKKIKTEKENIKRECDSLNVEKNDKVKVEQETFSSRISDWKDQEDRQVTRDYSKETCSGLYKVPSWPFYMLYTKDESKNLFRVEVKYDYATGAYNSDGSSQDITSLAFGEKPIQWQDLLMALRLEKKGILRSTTVSDAAVRRGKDGDINTSVFNSSIDVAAMQQYDIAWNFLRDYIAEKKLIFNGSVQAWGTSFNYFRYLKGKDLAFGVEVPFGYKSHRLKLDSDLGNYLTFDAIDGELESAITSVDSARRANDVPVWVADDQASFKSRTKGAMAGSTDILEHSMIPETLNYLLVPKGLSYLPKMSVTGIGDVATFLNYYVTTKYLEKFVLGARVSWPTAKDAATHKVWAPQLGNGFTKISAYASLLFNKQGKYFNPYTFLQASFSWPGHKKTRVPRIIKFDGEIVGEPTVINNLNYYRNVADGTDDGEDVSKYLKDFISFGQRIDYTQARAYTEYDTQIPAFADNVKSVRVQPGPEVEFRLGNMFEEFIFRRAFFDIYYNFMAKWKDFIGGNLPRDIWAVDLLKDNTYQLEHKFGGEFSYQFDEKTRLHVGADWVFAGRNVAKNLEIRTNIDVAF